MNASNVKVVLRAALASGVLSLAIGSCGRAADGEPLQIDSNTNWLMRCDSDEQCSGSLRCYCGQCSQPCATSDECSLLAGAECASTGGAVCNQQPAVGGLCVLGCSQDIDCGPDFRCTDNQCVPAPCSSPFQSWDDLLQQVAADLNGVDSDAAPFTRYISIANHVANAGCDGSASRQRYAVSKTLNSLSRSATIAAPVPIDSASTLYRLDLRDYGWERLTRVGSGYPWDILSDANPFAARFVGAQADQATARSGTSCPVMFADSFIATATRPDVYASIVGVPTDYRVLLAQLGIERTLQESSPPTVRAGFIDRIEMIATHWDTASHAGYLWELANVGGPDGALFQDPMRSPDGERAVIYTLPNGLQAFAFMDADNRWLAESNTYLDANVNNFRATAPVSLLRGHSPRVNVRDEVLDFMRENPDRFTPDARAAIAEQYLAGPELDALLELEAETFPQAALASAQIPIAIAEPISATVDAYNRDVTLEDVAGELMVTPEDLRNNLALLPSAFSVLDGGSMGRTDFAQLFHQALCTLAVINNNPPEAVLCE